MVTGVTGSQQQLQTKVISDSCCYLSTNITVDKGGQRGDRCDFDHGVNKSYYER